MRWENVGKVSMDICQVFLSVNLLIYHFNIILMKLISSPFVACISLVTQLHLLIVKVTNIQCSESVPADVPITY